MKKVIFKDEVVENDKFKKVYSAVAKFEYVCNVPCINITTKCEVFEKTTTTEIRFFKIEKREEFKRYIHHLDDNYISSTFKMEEKVEDIVKIIKYNLVKLGYDKFEINFTEFNNKCNKISKELIS